MFGQLFFCLIGVFLIYIGIRDGSAFDIALGAILMMTAGFRVYAAKSGVSFGDAVTKWRIKRNGN